MWTPFKQESFVSRSQFQSWLRIEMVEFKWHQTSCTIFLMKNSCHLPTDLLSSVHVARQTVVAASHTYRAFMHHAAVTLAKNILFHGRNHSPGVAEVRKLLGCPLLQETFSTAIIVCPSPSSLFAFHHKLRYNICKCSS